MITFFFFSSGRNEIRYGRRRKFKVKESPEEKTERANATGPCEPRGKSSTNLNHRKPDSLKIEFGKISAFLVLLNLGNRNVLKNNLSFSVYNSKTCSLQISLMIQKNI